MDHEKLKSQLITEGEALGLKGKDIRVLSTDPYFVGSPDDYQDAKWAASLWDKMMAARRKPLHLRGFHYWIQSQGIFKPKSSLSKKDIQAGKSLEKYAQGADPAADWGYLLHCAQMARYLGVGEWKNISDMKHPNPSDFDGYYVGSGMSSNGEGDIQQELTGRLNNLVDDLIQSIANYAPKYETDGYQVYHNEVWVEKNSMGFIIEPLCRRYEACYQALVGQASIEKVDTQQL